MQKYTQTPSRSDLMGGRVYLVAEIHPDSIEISSHGRSSLFKCRSQLRQLRDLISGAGRVYLVAEIHPDSIEISSHGRSSLFSCRNTPRLHRDLISWAVSLFSCRNTPRLHRNLISWARSSLYKCRRSAQTATRSDLMDGPVYLNAEIHPDSIEI